MLHFAKFAETKEEIYIFKTREARDAWVGHQDRFSVDMGLTAENAFFKRVPITQAQAVAIAGDAFDIKENYYVDEISGNLILYCPRRQCREVKQEYRYKMILDLLDEAQGINYYDEIRIAAQQMCQTR